MAVKDSNGNGVTWFRLGGMATALTGLILTVVFFSIRSHSSHAHAEAFTKSEFVLFQNSMERWMNRIEMNQDKIIDKLDKSVD